MFTNVKITAFYVIVVEEPALRRITFYAFSLTVYSSLFMLISITIISKKLLLTL